MASLGSVTPTQPTLHSHPFKITPWLVLHVLHFIGDFFYKTRTSLARAAFYRGFLLENPP